MIIMGAGICRWFHGDATYRSILSLLILTGCMGRNGGGWAHYVGQEKCRPITLCGNTAVLRIAAGLRFFPRGCGHHVRGWHPVRERMVRTARRGFATGVFGAGMGGTALSAFFTPRLVRSIGYLPTHLFIAGALIVVGAVLWLTMRDSPAWKPNLAPVVPKLTAAAKLPLTWQMSFLYAVVFGGFVAFSTYLPTYLRNVYEFGLTGAGTRTAGFAIAAVVARPVGGIVADKIGPRKVSRFPSPGRR